LNLYVATDFACAVVYTALAVLLWIHSQRSAAVRLLIAACALTGLWAGVVALDLAVDRSLAPAPGILDVLRAASWVAFLSVAYQTGRPPGQGVRGRNWIVGLGVLVGVLLILREFWVAASTGTDGAEPYVVASLYGRGAFAAAGLVYVEALLRPVRAEHLRRIRYLCLGVGGLLAYDLFVVSEALLFHRVDPVLAVGRGAVSMLAAPLIAAAAARNPAWATDLNIARRAVLRSATLFAVGVYFVGAGALGAALRATGGDWGRLLQLMLLSAAVLVVAVVWFSPSTRSMLELGFSRFFFTHRHDYREQWQRFAQALISPRSGKTLREQSLRAVADVVGSRKGGLWLRESGVFAQVAAMRLPPAADAWLDGEFVDLLERRRGKILELGEEAARLRLPEWLRELKEGWIVLPLVHRDGLIGVIVLGNSPAHRSLHPEDRELLSTLAHHVASYLSAEATTRSLEEARRFEELSRRTAFIAHDLRNLANELALTLTNARKHIQNPDFQRDLLLGMQDSVAGMQRMLDRLRHEKGEPVDSGPTDFARLVEGSVRSRAGDSSSVDLDLGDRSPHWIASDPDRLASMSGHLIQNAIEAAGPNGQVHVRLTRDGPYSSLEIEDDGPGMDADFLRERLLHPFRSSKPNGFGLGLYECRQLACELGGDLAIDSEPGRGTMVRLKLPRVDDPRAISERDAADD
jgi:putative PEP-CTERM system histidine kinase